MDKEVVDIIHRYIELVRAKYTVEQSFVFGSFAKNLQSENSDIDIAFIFPKLNDKEKFHIQVQLMLLASQIDLRIEPHPISKKEFTSENPFTREIKRTGIRIA